jgi:hypothetical protein
MGTGGLIRIYISQHSRNMRLRSYGKTTLIALLVCLCACSQDDRNAVPLSSEAVNLALRRAAHRLLIAAGDSTSRIPPVQHAGEGTWQVELPDGFEYDSLPAILQGALEAQGIEADYDVAILDCMDGLVQLGYSKADFLGSQGVPCGGRTMPETCLRLQIRFEEQATPSVSFAWDYWPLGGCLALLLLVLAWRQRPRKIASPSQEGLHFGNSRFDEASRILMSGGVRYELTHREAKLLHFFVQHPNTVLERGTILDKVWADEGIMVGRSVDMFVSRLRKFLANDSTVRLVAVHGVGYRMEVQE